MSEALHLHLHMTFWVYFPWVNFSRIPSRSRLSEALGNSSLLFMRFLFCFCFSNAAVMIILLSLGICSFCGIHVLLVDGTHCEELLVSVTDCIDWKGTCMPWWGRERRFKAGTFENEKQKKCCSWGNCLSHGTLPRSCYSFLAKATEKMKSEVQQTAEVRWETGLQGSQQFSKLGCLVSQQVSTPHRSQGCHTDWKAVFTLRVWPHGHATKLAEGGGLGRIARTVAHPLREQSSLRDRIRQKIRTQGNLNPKDSTTHSCAEARSEGYKWQQSQVKW